MEDVDTVVGNIAEEAARDTDEVAADEAAKDAAEDTAARAAKAIGEASAEGANGGPAGEARKALPRKRWLMISLPPPQPRAPADI